MSQQALTALLGRPGATITATVPVLLYHLVNSAVNDPLCVKPKHFIGHIRALQDAGYQVVSLSNLEEARRNGSRKIVVLTFDDGYADNVTEALPILTRYKASATMFLSTAYIGQDNLWNPRATYRTRHASLRGLQEWLHSGQELQPHGHEHQSFLKLSRSEISSNIRRSRDIVGQLTKSTPYAFAYPFGHHNANIRDMLRGSFRIAFSVGMQSEADPLALPRICVDDTVSPSELLKLCATRPRKANLRKYYV